MPPKRRRSINKNLTNTSDFDAFHPRSKSRSPSPVAHLLHTLLPTETSVTPVAQPQSVTPDAQSPFASTCTSTIVTSTTAIPDPDM